MTVSRESTMTLGRDELVNQQNPRINRDFPRRSLGPRTVDNASEQPSGNRLIIAVDFGTTYSAVSYVPLVQGRSSDPVDPRSICSITNFPENRNYIPNDQMVAEVPTEVIYPLNKHFREEWSSNTTNQSVANGFENEVPEHTSNPVLDLNSEHENQYGLDDDVQMLGSLSDDQFRWGYQVHELLSLPSTHLDSSNQPLSRFKLVLDNSPVTKALRERVQHTVHKLKKQRIVSGSLCVITDFLTCLLKHTERELQNEGYDDSFQREIVLCVPAIWTQQACRYMQTSMAAAMKRADFRGVDTDTNSIENLFIVSEPEAAAAYVLADEHGLDCGDVFVLLDAGGGTVDANTYEISETTPLRLSREVVAPGGGLYGSSFINEKFRDHLRRRLASETYLETDTETINGIIEEIMIDQFEYRIKRSFDLYAATDNPKRFHVSGLREDRSKGFSKGCIIVPTMEIRKIFLECLEGIGSILEDQIKAAKERNYQVQKIVLIGGFALSKSLRHFLQARIDRFNEENSTEITLLSPRTNTANAVASGAVLRALNKEQGPRRIARSSYGILRTEPFGFFPEHQGLRPSYDRHDGLPYIAKTIDWVLKLGQHVDPVWECAPFVSSHTFGVWPIRPLICREVLYVSDHATRSHFKLSHPNNEGAECVGEIVVDATFLRDQGIIEPVEPTMDDKGQKRGTKHWKVECSITIRVVDRHLECDALFKGSLRKKCRINIAAAFLPGVK